MAGFSPTLYDPMLLPSENPFTCHEEVLSLQPIIPPKRFDIFPLTGGCSEGLDDFIFVFKQRGKLQETKEINNKLLFICRKEGSPRKKANNMRLPVCSKQFKIPTETTD